MSFRPAVREVLARLTVGIELVERQISLFRLVLPNEVREDVRLASSPALLAMLRRRHAELVHVRLLSSSREHRQEWHDPWNLWDVL